MEKPAFPVAVVMQRRIAQSRWADYVWEPVRVLRDEDPHGAPRAIMEDAQVQQWLHPGFRIVIHRDEGEGYYLNCLATVPKVFVLWRMDDDRGVPVEVTASTEEAGRWMDGGHSIDGVPMTPEIFAWLGAWVEANYRPEPKQRIKPRSFKHPKDRV